MNLNEDPLRLALEKVSFFSDIRVKQEESILIYDKRFIIRSESGKIKLLAEIDLPDEKVYNFIISIAKEICEIQRKNR